MKKWYIGLAAAVMIAAAGCSPQSNTEAVSSAEASAEARESQETEQEEEETEDAGEGEEESFQEARESMKAAEESLKALEESLQAAEESLQAAEESAQAESDFAALEKEPEKYEKKQVKFSGTVVRAAGIGNTSGQLVVAVDGDEKQRLVAEYKKSIVNTALAVGDKLTLTGEFQGIIRYRMQSGGAESMPTVNVEKFEDIVKAVPETRAEPQTLFDVSDTQPERMEIPAGEITSGESDETELPADSDERDGDDGEIMDAEPSAETSPVISAGQ